MNADQRAAEARRSLREKLRALESRVKVLEDMWELAEEERLQHNQQEN